MARLSCLLLLCCLFVSAWGGLMSKLRSSVLQEEFLFAENFVKQVKEVSKIHQLRDISVECGLCGIVVNEIEGFMSENETEQDIMNEIDNNICAALSGTLQQACDELVSDIPEIITRVNNMESVGVVCVNLGWCQQPINPHPDPGYVPQYVINMDLPPIQRWTAICSNSSYQAVAQYLVNTVKSILPGGGEILQEIGRELNQYYFPTEFAQEIQGCATALGVDYGWVSLLNLGYEVSDACTSIVAQTTDGKILHARNLDFWEGMGFTDSLRDIAMQISWQKGGKTQFMSTTFAGYVGFLSGFKAHEFSCTIDTRFYPDGLWELFYEIIAAIETKNASLVGFLSRTVFQNENDFEAAVSNLAKGQLIADVYYIVAGVSAGQGVVISRNRDNASDIWRLSAPARWFEVETNYDHWNNPPWFDDRVTPANKGMTAMGQKAVTLDGMYKVLSTKPVFNLQTTYTILSCPADGTYKSFVRNCPYPCAE